MREKSLILILAALSISACRWTRVPNLESSVTTSIAQLEDLYAKELISWKDIFKQELDKYYVYVFSFTCYYCKLVKEEVNVLANYGGFALYFVEYNDEIPVKSYSDSLIGTNDINDLFIVGTPTLFFISNGSVEEVYYGFNRIKEYINEVVDIN